MFETVLGIPAHPLLVHAAVVFVPLMALSCGLYAAVPRLRPYLHWPVAALAVAGPLAALAAKLSGDTFRGRLIARNLASPEILTKVAQHKSYGDITMWLAILLGLATLGYIFLLPWLVSGVRPASADAEAPAASPAPAIAAASPAGSAVAAGGSLAAVAPDETVTEPMTEPMTEPLTELLTEPVAAAAAGAAPAGTAAAGAGPWGTVSDRLAGGVRTARAFGDQVAQWSVRRTPPPLTATGATAIEIGLRVATLVLAAIVTYYVVRTGHSGAQTVWKGY